MNTEELFDRSVTGSGTGFDQVFRHRYSTTIGDLWSALTTPDRIARWLGPVAERTADGATYMINIGSGEAVVPAMIKVRACTPPTALTVGWQWQGEPVSEVSARLREVEGGLVELTLRHRDITRRPLVIGYGGGWESCLLALGIEAGAEKWTADQLGDHEQAARDAWQLVLEKAGR